MVYKKQKRSKTGRLTQEEKYIIQGMLHDNKTTEDIAKHLVRTTSIVDKYINGELDRIHSTVAKIELDQANAKIKQQKQKINQLEQGKPNITQIKSAVQKHLVAADLTKEQADDLIKRAIKQYGKPKDIDTLLAFCAKARNVKDLMITNAPDKRHKVAIMTPTASERLDETRNRTNKKPTRPRDHLFNIREGKLMDE